MIRSCVLFLLVLVGVLANPVAGSSQVNRRLAMEYLNRGMIMLLRRQDAEAQREFAKAIEFDSNLKADLEKSIDQMRRARQENAAKP